MMCIENISLELFDRVNIDLEPGNLVICPEETSHVEGGRLQLQTSSINFNFKLQTSNFKLQISSFKLQTSTSNFNLIFKLKLKT